MTAEARSYGYVTTIHGRRLYVPHSKPYVGTNYKIQGSAAEILKVAQNRVHHYLEEKTQGAAGLILPIHDEIIIEWPRSILYKAPKMLAKVHELMTDFPKLDAPLDVGVEVATHDWSKKEDYNAWKDHTNTVTS
jgi:DNA polymerase I-like protein with 3'-5' exonuclease and polymerase domains